MLYLGLCSTYLTLIFCQMVVDSISMIFILLSFLCLECYHFFINFSMVHSNDKNKMITCMPTDLSLKNENNRNTTRKKHEYNHFKTFTKKSMATQFL